MEQFLNGKVSLYRGDCLEVLPTLDEGSVDACVCDPPYHLTSIVKRYSKGDAKTENSIKLHGTQKVSPYMRGAKGFMGKQWDGGDIAFRPEVWMEVLRVLKPGGHLLAFSGTRTYHRMACAIEDAGFEIRDQIGWAYGSGFPKSHDISKAIDRLNGKNINSLKGELRRVFDQSKLTLAELNNQCGFEASGYLRTSSTWAGVLPSVDKWLKMRQVIGCHELLSNAFVEAEREVIRMSSWTNSAKHFVPGEDHSNRVQLDITAPATDAAIQWQGWGTALKPAWEPICLARKPLSESSIASNVLKHGTGAINIDGCRVEHQSEADRASATPGGRVTTKPGAFAGKVQHLGDRNEIARPDTSKGRWPANLIHDGSEEVLAGFPESVSSGGTSPAPSAEGYGYADKMRNGGLGDSGSAARFFYTAKADADDRLGSKHPTIKPIDLMQYLVRLITPKGGTVLDPFAGTGTCAEAAYYEGMRAILIEREPEYQADIVKRMGLVLSGPDSRRGASIKQESLDDTPLFGRLVQTADQ